MTAPERIWARPDYNECWPKRLEEEDVEYIRADLAAVRSEQARVLAMRDAGYDTPSLDPRDEVITALEWYAEDSSSQGDMARAALAAAEAVMK